MMLNYISPYEFIRNSMNLLVLVFVREYSEYGVQSDLSISNVSKAPYYCKKNF